jgi:hypothetical protein
MLFRDHDGNLVEINRMDYKNDSIYYKKIESIRMGENQMGEHQMGEHQMGEHQMGENQMGEKGLRKATVAGSGSIEQIMSLVEKSKTEN